MSLAQTIKKTTPLLVAGLAAYLALRVGLFNIGVEGQLVVGALATAAVSSRVGGLFGLLLGVVVAMLAGALWALPAGLIKAYRGGHEVITTIMMNNVAGLFVLALAAGPLKAPGQQSPETADVLLKIGSFTLWGVELSYAVPLAIIVVAGLFLWFGRTVAGYEWQAVGANPTAARFAGISTPRVILSAMLVSGMVAGLAGALQVLAYEGRFYPEISSGLGFDALGVALLAGTTFVGLLVSAFGFGILANGGTKLAILGVPKGLTEMVIGVLIVVAAVFRYRRVVTEDE